MDRRRESSRYAARDRRGKEADVFDLIKDEVPVVSETTATHVDRIALLRVCATLCKLRKSGQKLFKQDYMVKPHHTNNLDPSLFNETSLYSTLDGFVIVLDSEDTILYCTESVSFYLGVTQTDLVGNPMSDYCEHNDHNRLTSKIHKLKTFLPLVHKDRTEMEAMTIRMKTIISPRGRTLNLKSALFKSTITNVSCIRLDGGWLTLLYMSSEPAAVNGNNSTQATGTVKAVDEVKGQFTTRHTCDLKFSFVNENFANLFKRESKNIVGTSLYDYVFPDDANSVATAIKELFATGSAQTIYYRMATIENTGNVLWMMTVATTVKHTSKGQKGQYVICNHSFLGSQKEEESFFSPLPCNLEKSNIAEEIDIERADTGLKRKASYEKVLQYLLHDGSHSEIYLSEFRKSNRCSKVSDILEEGGRLGILEPTAYFEENEPNCPVPVRRRRVGRGGVRADSVPRTPAFTLFNEPIEEESDSNPAQLFPPTNSSPVSFDSGFSGDGEGSSSTNQPMSVPGSCSSQYMDYSPQVKREVDVLFGQQQPLFEPPTPTYTYSPKKSNLFMSNGSQECNGDIFNPSDSQQISFQQQPQPTNYAPYAVDVPVVFEEYRNQMPHDVTSGNVQSGQFGYENTDMYSFMPIADLRTNCLQNGNQGMMGYNECQENKPFYAKSSGFGHGLKSCKTMTNFNKEMFEVQPHHPTTSDNVDWNKKSNQDLLALAPYVSQDEVQQLDADSSFLDFFLPNEMMSDDRRYDFNSFASQ
uniref:PAS domain-containing protein n=1 Tax=Rhabditophanes sp. KR3021 TaxID=114890 RepID=A0AC35TTL5_9BILA